MRRVARCLRGALYVLGSMAGAVYLLAGVLAAQMIPAGRFAACVGVAALVVWAVVGGRTR